MRFTQLINAVDAHACGEPGRVITGGILDVPGRTMFEKMKYFQRHRDHIRLSMLRVPCGYPAANCSRSRRSYLTMQGIAKQGLGGVTDSGNAPRLWTGSNEDVSSNDRHANSNSHMVVPDLRER